MAAKEQNSPVSNANLYDHPIYNHESMIVLSAELTKQLSSREVRLPPQYIGIRRVRPSSKIVHKVLVQQKNKDQNLSYLKPNKTSVNHHDRDENNNLNDLSDISKVSDNVCTNPSQDTTVDHNHIIVSEKSIDDVTSASSLNENTHKVYTTASFSVDSTNNNQNSNIVFKTVDPLTGLERRMNKNEKKLYKYQMMQEKKSKKISYTQEKRRVLESRDQEKKRARKKLKMQQPTQMNSDPISVPHHSETKENQIQSEKKIDNGYSTLHNELSSNQNKLYLPFDIDPAIIEQELADLQGQRDGVPPVLLSPPMAYIALKHQKSLFPCNGFHENIDCPSFLDEELTTMWCEQLRNSMQLSEEIRQQEDMRPMPYKLVPEPWNRLRPDTLKRTNHQTKSNKYSNKVCSDLKSRGAYPESPGDLVVETNSSKQKTKTVSAPSPSWNFCQVRNRNPESTAFDVAAFIILDLLHTNTNLHVACGAKFGCDYLLYDGPRNERHAFAGLRILPMMVSDTINSNKELLFRQQTPYELSGYVRCLNTAGKLALIATVMTTTNEDGCEIDYNTFENGENTIKSGKRMNHRVAIVDLALEKIIETTTNRPKKTLEQRLQTLSKLSY